MLGILGGGFGLYGYLPAAVTLLQEPVLLLNKYKPIIDSRQELLSFKDQIIWLESEEELIQTADSLVISRRPIDQEALASKCLLQTNLKRIMFEKPLASTPEKAQKILDQVAKSDKHCSVGFTFRFTAWAIQLKEKLINGEFTEHESINLSWHFMADHFSRNLQSWKMDHAQGGGAIRFYGIHVIALLAELGYRDVAYSIATTDVNSNNYFYWKAIFISSNHPEITVEINTKSTRNTFLINENNSNNTFHVGVNPFDEENNKSLIISNLDTRFNYLKALLIVFIKTKEQLSDRFIEAVKLWRIIEQKTIITNKFK